MNQAARYLVGVHDFRNLAKLDVENVSNFKREIYFAHILPFSAADNNDSAGNSDSCDDSRSIYMLEIRGIAFLWHMVRCIMAVLFLVGRGEDPDIVRRLLDIDSEPQKPDYKIAPEAPLVLHECGFDRLKMNYEPKALWELTAHFEKEWEDNMLAASRFFKSLI